MRVVPVLLLLGMFAALPASAGAQDPCAHREAGTPKRAPGAPRPPLVLSDSSELLAVEPLVKLGLEADARGCRPLSDAVTIISARKRAGSLPRVVVFGLGANGGADRGLLARALRILGKRGKLGLVTPATTPAAASTMRAFARARPRRTILIDWAASGLWQRYGGDGIHIGYEGEAVLAEFIHRHVRPYTRPRASIPFGARKAEDCGRLRAGGKRRHVLILRGRDRATCAIARHLARMRDKTRSTAFRWFDWRFVGRPPWKDVFVRADGRVVIATRTPESAPAPDPGTDRPAPSA